MRLQQGDYDRETVYDDDPVAVARRFAAAGARWIHVVDLDAAAIGGDANRAVDRGDLRRGRVHACRAAAACATSRPRVALLEPASHASSSAPPRSSIPELVDELAARYPRQVAVGLDARGRDVAIHGWIDGDRRRPRRASRGASTDPGVGALVVTEIGRDGMLGGPDLDAARERARRGRACR